MKGESIVIDATAASVQLLADRFVEWQTPYGRPDPDRCPFVTPGPCISTQFHSPTFLAIALYRAYEATRDVRYLEAADRYTICYLAALRDPLPGEQRVDRPSYPFMYGMGLAAYEDFRRGHPEETWFEEKATAVFEWLIRFRWEEGSWFRNGYGNEAHGAVDCGFSEDNLNIGRGLLAYHAVTGRSEALREAEGLAGYYLTPIRPQTYEGCWSDELGTWAVGPTSIDSFEHFEGRRSYEIGWGFTSVGAIEYLTRLAGLTERPDLREGVTRTCVASMKWQFDSCQFPDGGVGLAGRDDKWLGMTAGAILSYLRVRDAGFLSPAEAQRYSEKAALARDWLLENTTAGAVDRGGYFNLTGQSEPRPPENLAWMLAWTLLALLRLGDV